MARILFLIVLIVLLYVIIKRFSAFLGGSQHPQSKQSTQSGEERIVQCVLCGTHIPESESTQLDAKTVCKQQPCKH
ncbi:hypothetical protein Meth11DRAFT_0298 [Methylophilaceae bacterium 11]|nr:hypothetical protein Meth11DRAFT_0298 [Methylophilaceae bacterium 11]